MFQDLILMRGKNYHRCDLETGALSLKCMFNGGVLYETPDARYIVDDSHYLILNDEQAYAMEKPAGVLSVCVFFPAHWSSEILRAYSEADDALLENPSKSFPVHFFETLQRHDNLVSPYVAKLRTIPFQEPVMNAKPYEEFLRGLLAAMLQTQRNLAASAERLPEARRSTRIELLRRLSLARDTLHACYNQDLSIETLANIAGLSPYHFIRKFKAAFQETPHQYLRNLRLEKARELLRTSDLPITEICYAIGFQSLGTFSTSFQKETGYSPSAYRIAQF